MSMRRKNAAIWNVFTLIILALFLIFVVYPLALILYKSVINPADNSFTIENFTHLLPAILTWRVMYAIARPSEAEIRVATMVTLKEFFMVLV